MTVALHSLLVYPSLLPLFDTSFTISPYPVIHRKWAIESRDTLDWCWSFNNIVFQNTPQMQCEGWRSQINKLGHFSMGFHGSLFIDLTRRIVDPNYHIQLYILYHKIMTRPAKTAIIVDNSRLAYILLNFFCINEGHWGLSISTFHFNLTGSIGGKQIYARQCHRGEENGQRLALQQ